MGTSSWSDDAFNDIAAPRAAKSVAAVRSTTFRNNTLDPLMDPRGVTRESRDSDAHPRSNAIAVLFDVTGSMGDIPAQFAQKYMGSFMKVLVDQGAIEDPQVLIGAIGDSYCDTAPLQVGQFESGLELDMWLTKVFLENGGGGQAMESYGLAPYFALKHTSLDCWEKRGKKATLFTIGDEFVHPQLRRDEIQQIFGDNVQQDIEVRQLIKDVQERFNYFHICVRSGSYTDGHHEQWKEILGERALYLQDYKDICGVMAGVVALLENNDMNAALNKLRGAGIDDHTVKATGTALAPLSLSLAKTGGYSGVLPPPTTGATRP